MNKHVIFLISVLTSVLFFFGAAFAQDSQPSLYQAHITLNSAEIDGATLKLELEMGADPIQLEIPLTEDVVNPDQRNNMLLKFSDVSFEMIPSDGAAAWNSGIIEDFTVAIDFRNPDRNKRAEIGDTLDALPTLLNSVEFAVNDAEIATTGGIIAMQLTNMVEDKSTAVSGVPGFWIDNSNPRAGADNMVINASGTDLTSVTEPKVIIPNFFRYSAFPVGDIDLIDTLKLKFGKLAGEFSTGDASPFNYVFFADREFELVFAKTE